MWKLKWKLYGKLSWAYCKKAEKLINNSDRMDPNVYGRRLEYLIDKMMYYMDKRLKLCM